MRIAVNLYFTDMPDNGSAVLFEALQEIGASHVGCNDDVRAPIGELARDHQYLDYAETISNASNSLTGATSEG